MEVEAVLEALVAEAEDGGADVVGAALGFEDGEDVRVDALSVTALRMALGEQCLLNLAFEEFF